LIDTDAQVIAVIYHTADRYGYHHDGHILPTLDHSPGHLFRDDPSKFARQQLSTTGRALRIVKYVSDFPICIFTCKKKKKKIELVCLFS
jgi:hypothetical protein